MANFVPAAESPGREHALENRPAHPLEIVALIMGEQLHLSWQFSGPPSHAQRVQRLAAAYEARLQQLLAVARTARADACPSLPEDFPLLQISQDALDRLWAQLVGGAVVPPTGNALLEDLYPLSGMQAGLLFHSQASGLYVEQQRFVLKGAVQFPALIASWQQLLAAHPILRTSIVGEEVLAQAVWRSVPLPLTVIDARGLSSPEQEAVRQALPQADRGRGFVRTQAPLLRVCLLLGADQCQVVWSFHHALLDGWSVSLLLQEFFARYQALIQGQEAPPSVSPPYRAYINWLQQQDQAAAETFWRDELAGITAPTPLPLATGAALGQADGTGNYGQERLRLGLAVSQQLQTVARALHITVNTLVQASWAAVLSRYSGQAEVLFGMVVAGRDADLVGIESLVGLCMNTIPVRLRRPAHDTAVGDWLRQVHAHLAHLQRFSFAPLWQIQRLSGLDADQPLFHSLFVFENYPVEQTLEQLRQTDLRLRESEDAEASEPTNYALTATVLPGEQLTLEASFQEVALVH